jgi:hypothetical protein
MTARFQHAKRARGTPGEQEQAKFDALQAGRKFNQGIPDSTVSSPRLIFPGSVILRDGAATNMSNENTSHVRAAEKERARHTDVEFGLPLPGRAGDPGRENGR